MLDRVPTSFVRWVAVELAGLLIVGLLILAYSRLAPGLGTSHASGPAGWVPAPAIASPVSAPTGGTGQGTTGQPVRTPTAAPTAPTQPVRHNVQPGETLSQIANQYGVSVDAIVAANRLQDPDNLKVGQEIVIPSPGAPTPAVESAPPTQVSPTPEPPALAPTAAPAPAITRYRVEPGDSLNSIAQRFGVSVAAIIQANNLANGDDINIGQELVIPSP